MILRKIFFLLICLDSPCWPVENRRTAANQRTDDQWAINGRLEAIAILIALAKLAWQQKKLFLKETVFPCNFLCTSLSEITSSRAGIIFTKFAKYLASSLWYFQRDSLLRRFFTKDSLVGDQWFQQRRARNLPRCPEGQWLRRLHREAHQVC